MISRWASDWAGGSPTTLPNSSSTPVLAGDSDMAEVVKPRRTAPIRLTRIQSPGKLCESALVSYVRVSAGALQFQSVAFTDGSGFRWAPVRYAFHPPDSASNAAADIPGIAPDGSEIED